MSFGSFRTIEQVIAKYPLRLEKAKVMVKAGIKTVWVIEPYSRSVFVVTAQGKALFHEEMVESEGVSVDFAKVFR